VAIPRAGLATAQAVWSLGVRDEKWTLGSWNFT
jgi:hypothetical protein